MAGVVTSFLFAVVSALHVTRFGSVAALQVGARTIGSSGRHRLRRVLVVGELALSLVLLIGAGLLVRSFALLSAVDPGFDPAGVLTMKLSLVDSQYPYRSPENIARFYRQLNQRVRKLAGIVWPGEDPIGRCLQVEIFLNGERSPQWAEVIGVVEHLRHHPSRIGIEQIYLPHQQSPQRTMALAIRGTLDQKTLVDAVKREVRTLNADQPAHDVRRMEEYLSETLASMRFSLSALAVFAFMALTLASVGIYGVIAYTVNQRTREIGIRLALGATPKNIVESFLGQGMVLTAAGLALGLSGAAALARYLSSFLYGVSATDPATFVVISVLLATVRLRLVTCRLAAPPRWIP